MPGTNCMGYLQIASGLFDGRKLAQNILFRKCIDDLLLKLVGYEVTAGLVSAFPQGIAQSTETKESIICFGIHRICQRGYFLGRNLSVLQLVQTQFGVLYGHSPDHNSFLLSIKQPAAP